MPSRTKKRRTNNTTRYSSSQLLNFARDSYLERTSRPIYAIAFLLPFMAFYELGTSLINTDVLNRFQIRVVAFVWLQDLLDYAGFGSRFAWIAAPLAVIIILLALQLTSKTGWKVRFGDLAPMMGECLVLAIPLIVLSLLLNRPSTVPHGAAFAPAPPCVTAAGVAWPKGSAATVAMSSSSTSVPLVVRKPPHSCGGWNTTCLTTPIQKLSATSTARSAFFVNFVTGIGAGIYEELVFRLILICLLMLILQDVAGLEHMTALIIAVLLSAGLFSAHHYIIFLHGRVDQTVCFDWPSFVFRTAAGVYFAGLFAVRGFGITAGCHAFYDMLAAILNLLFFTR